MCRDVCSEFLCEEELSWSKEGRAAGFGRNLVLGLWENDVQHLLMVTDCGVSEEASEEEPPRASLVREIYRFLDYHVSVVLRQEPDMLFGLLPELAIVMRNGVMHQVVYMCWNVLQRLSFEKSR
jgi:hypothetical protein